MNPIELCSTFGLLALHKRPGSKPLRTFVDDNGDFTIEEEDDESLENDSEERSTGYQVRAGEE